MRWLSLLLALLSLAGCHSAVAEAKAAYREARYPAAAAQFRAAERETRTLDAKGLASYALYRGLTHLALGDARAAASWLGYAKVSADQEPEVFDDEDRGALLAAWRSMGRMPGETGFPEGPEASPPVAPNTDLDADGEPSRASR